MQKLRRNNISTGNKRISWTSGVEGLPGETLNHDASRTVNEFRKESLWKLPASSLSKDLENTGKWLGIN